MKTKNLARTDLRSKPAHLDHYLGLAYIDLLLRPTHHNLQPELTHLNLRLRMTNFDLQPTMTLSRPSARNDWSRPLTQNKPSRLSTRDNSCCNFQLRSGVLAFGTSLYFSTFDMGEPVSISRLRRTISTFDLSWSVWAFNAGGIISTFGLTNLSQPSARAEPDWCIIAFEPRWPISNLNQRQPISSFNLKGYVSTIG